MALARQSNHKPMTVKQVNNLLQAYDLNIIIGYEMENRKQFATIKDLRKNNTWLRNKLDLMYQSQNAYVKRVRENNEEYETTVAELTEQNDLFRKKLILQYKHFRKLNHKIKKDN
tara:strand:- start:5 stop:349 length:345 start_codon:yes stop_codon:yes gene_type:complete